VASVIGKDGAVFTADAVSHVIKELSTNAVTARSTVPRELSASINVEDVLDKILQLDDFIKIKIETYSSSTIYGTDNKKAVKYKFKNVLIGNSVYDIMLNHQKTWSHQKVAEYLEAKFLLRIEQLAAGSFEYDSDEETDGFSVGTILPNPQYILSNPYPLIHTP
jgi:predicted ATPase